MNRWYHLFCLLLAFGLLFALAPLRTRTAWAQAAWVVTTAADEGSGSLRALLLSAPAGATITFDPGVFPPESPVVIPLEGEPLEMLQGRITLDATGAGVVLDGARMDGDVLWVLSDGNVLRGLTITGAPGVALVVENGADNVIGGRNTAPGEGCAGDCIHIYGVGQGIHLRGERTSNNSITGNLLGVADADADLPAFAQEALLLSAGAHDNVIGGETPAERNVINAGGEGAGLVLEGRGTSGNRVIGNFIGTDVSGTAALGNSNGISLWAGAAENVIGGGDPLVAGACTGTCNLISGNDWEGVDLGGEDCHDNAIVGNFIGTDLSGTRALGNRSNGIIASDGARATHIERNLISGNGSGVVLEASPGGDTVAGNWIGVDISGEAPLGNRAQGVCPAAGTVGAVIGPDNVIAHNGAFGVLMDPQGVESAIPVVLMRNRIYANGDRLFTGGDIGSFVPPRLRVAPPTLRVEATGVHGAASASGAQVEVYAGDRPGELRTYLGTATTGTDGAFTLGVPGARMQGQWVTALLTAEADGVSATSLPAAAFRVGAPLLLMPLPGVATLRTVSLDPARIGVNLALALVSVLWFGFTSTVSNNILESNAEEINERLGRWLPRGIRSRLEKSVEPAAMVGRKRWWSTWLAILVVSALIESFLAPGPLVSVDRLGTFVSLAVASCLLGAVQFAVALRVRRRLVPDVEAVFVPQALGLAMAIGAVIVSRALDFQPGYIYGIVGALAVLPELASDRDAGRRALHVLGALLVVGLLAWLLEPAAERLSRDLAALLQTVFVVSLQSVFFALPPLAITDGGDLYTWNRRVWGACALGVGFLFFHIVMNPGFEDVQLLQANTVFSILVLYAMSGVVTLSLWLGFRKAG